MVEPGLQPLVLRLLGDVEEELDDGRAVVALLRLELVDLVIGAAPFGLGGEALDPLDQDAAVPAAVEDRDLAGAGQPLPEAPEDNGAPSPPSVGAAIGQTWKARGSHSAVSRWIAPPLPAASQPSKTIIALRCGR